MNFSEIGRTRNLTLLLFLAAILFGAITYKFATTTVSGSSMQVKSSIVELISSESPTERISGRNLLRESRRNEILQLMEIARVQSSSIRAISYVKPDDALSIAIELLGEYRAVVAIPLLINLKGKVVLESVKDSGRREGISVPARFIGAGALIKIGNPSLDLILAELQSNADISTLDIQLDTIILKEILGERFARLTLNELQESEQDPRILQNLAAASQTIEQNVVNKWDWTFDGSKLRFGPDPSEIRFKIR